ncbi:signal transduction histidine kinase [Saccharomonospora marina XMU15]|uniref:histidine kinase n=1 Tax=Saccharomonospora marina XMU15 TaxID=882083 RepID=H5WWF3_9PSEU|nr:histidine kinase [Saccharomonospora marina]EHR49437.1 signal transduction histidine kinase [Saccharomonospora marina XMU15]
MDPIRDRRADLLDAALAVGVTGLVLADALLGQPRPAPLDYALLSAGSLVIAVRARFPRTVLLVSLVLGLAYLSRVDPGAVAAVPVLIAIYTAVSVGHRLLGIAVVVPLMVFAVLDNLAAEGGTFTAGAIQDAILPVGWFFAALVLGEVTRHRRAYLRQAEQRAAEALRTREEVARRRAEEERVRIARELHDSLTHQISIVKLQAGVAIHLARKRGEEVPDALLAIQHASAEANKELRATLEVLRDDKSDKSTACTHGLLALPTLVEQARAAGVTAKVTVDGDTTGLPSDIDTAAYRIVQEALTNVARHAGSGEASVRVGVTAGELTLRIDDNGSADPRKPPVPGVGLLGMRERVTALGGRLSAGARPGGGFTVEAALPLEGKLA